MYNDKMKTKYLLLFLFTLLQFDMLFSQTKLLLKSENGIKKINGKINSVPIEFIFDTGATNVSISLTEALFLIKNQRISKKDILGTTYSQLANGEIVEATKIIIDEIDLGGIKLNRILATISYNSDAPILLGQSVISKLGKVTMQGNSLIISKKSKNAFNDKTFNFETIKLRNENGFNVSLRKYIIERTDSHCVHYAGGKNFKLDQFCEFYDLDQDNSPELVIIIPSYGSIGLETIKIFSYKNNSFFTYSTEFKTSRSEIIIDHNINIIRHEVFIGFYSCNACHMDDQLPNYITLFETYKYDGGELIKSNKSNFVDNKLIIENLTYLSKLKFPLSENDTDNGQRKAFAHNLYLLYLNNEGNLDLVKQAIVDYYPEDDKQEFFDAFYQILNSHL